MTTGPPPAAELSRPLLATGDDDQDDEDEDERRPSRQPEGTQQELGDEEQQLEAQPEGQRQPQPEEHGLLALQAAQVVHRPSWDVTSGHGAVATIGCAGTQLKFTVAATTSRRRYGVPASKNVTADVQVRPTPLRAGTESARGC